MLRANLSAPVGVDGSCRLRQREREKGRKGERERGRRGEREIGCISPSPFLPFSLSPGEMTKRYFIGLNAGASLFGVDAALVRVEGFGTDARLQLEHFRHAPY